MTEIEPGKPCSAADLNRLETRLGRRLPDDLRRFSQQFGDAFVGGTLDGNDRHSVLRFVDLARLDETHSVYAGEYLDVGAVPFADCDLGGIYILKADDTVWFRLVYSGQLILEQVATSFSDFVHRLKIVD